MKKKSLHLLRIRLYGPSEPSSAIDSIRHCKGSIFERMHQIVIIEVIQVVVSEVIEIDLVIVIQQQWLRALALYWLNLHRCSGDA